MTRQAFAIEKALRIYKENSDTLFIDLLFGSAAPGGDTGEQDDAPIGSMYFRQNSASSTIYQKIADTNATSDWQENGSTSVQLGFRSEKIRAVTSEAITNGARNLTTTPFTDDDGTTLTAANFAVGEFIISTAGGTAVLHEVTVVASPNVTFAAPVSAPALAQFDTFLTPNYLPDPNGQENQALVQINGSGNVVKVGDVDWEFATGINLSSGYGAANGTITSADSVESAIEKLDGNQQDIQTASGITQGATNYGTFTGTTIPDSSTNKAALQSLETAYEETDANVDDLVTLSGVAKNSTVLGAFSSPASLLMAATYTIKSAFQRLGDLMAQLRGVEETGITTVTTVDSVPVATVRAVKWLVTASEDATPANRKAFEVYALNDGVSGGDVDDTVYASLRVGSNFNLTLAVDVATTDMRLRATSSSAGVTVTARRIEVVKNVL